MPGSVSKPSLGLFRKVEERISSTPLRSLLTKKTAPPPSRAWLRRIRVPASSTRKSLPSAYSAPPEPPPGVPERSGLAPRPRARLPLTTLWKTAPATPMLLSAAPLLQTPRVNVLATTYTGRPWCCDSARTAPPPRSGPVGSQRLPVNVEETILSRPPRAKIAPPPPPSEVSPVASPSANRMFCTTSRGVAWSSQWDVVQVCCRSHVFWYRIRRCPP